MSPRLLDLFCGAGGAAMGYARAGWEVVGIDIEPQPHYPFEFRRADALGISRVTFDLIGPFDAIHASPPCQRYSAAAEIHDSAETHPDLIDPTRELLEATGLPWVMENVERAPMRTTFVLCGSMFDLGVRRHRQFESSWMMLSPGCGSHDRWYCNVYGGRTVGRQRVTHGGPGVRTQTWDKFENELKVGSDAMGIDWMDMAELSEAIPPAYTEFIGARLLERIAVAA